MRSENTNRPADPATASSGRTQPEFRPRGLYVHIPFCKTKCPYCDFNTYARIEDLVPRYVDALQAEISLWGALLHHPPLETVFFGGGTPSYLPADRIVAILEAIRGSFGVSAGAEVSLEANPGDLTPAKLDALRRVGINRLSIGVQSLDDRLLEALGRRHSAADARRSYHTAVDAGFDNVSIDLMYGLPHQTLTGWRDTLDGIISLGPPHVSMYCLTLEQGTPLAQWVQLGKVPEPDPDLAADMYEMAEERMGQRGYRHYEISNWAKPGFPSRHNLIYWRNQPFLGVGPGAHSYLGGFRFANLKSPREYIERLDSRPPLPKASSPMSERIAGVPVVDTVEAIGPRLEMAETMMMGLRLDTGIISEDFARRFGRSPAEVYPDDVADLAAVGLLEDSDGALKLTPRGRMLGNEVFSRFLAAESV
ncbi:MAG: radical SAM family heme chaperone HemW [Chloroflexi bacterium]|nr:radical SAM family heme chaperone HemW [Chloroflexota bacterium]